MKRAALYLFASFLSSAIFSQSPDEVKDPATRGAPVEQGALAGAGGGIETVVEKGRTTGNVITPIKR